MRKYCSLLSVHFLLFSFLFLGAARTYAENDAVRPVPRPDQWWQDRNAAANARLQQGNVDVLFIGDSITHGWDGAGGPVWRKYYADRNAVNLGFGGDGTQHVLWRLQNAPWEAVSPKLAVIMIGTNNIHKNSPEEIAEGITEIVRFLQQKFPPIKILLLAIFPRADVDQPRLAKIPEVNRLIAKLHDGEHVVFMDIGKEFLDENGNLPKSIMPDLLHPNERGYWIWARAIEPKVAELLGTYDAENPPKGFVSLFNGKDLTGWKGLVENPEKRAQMSEQELREAQAKADEVMRAHWSVQDGVLYFDGDKNGSHLCTARDYEDFEMLVDWKIMPRGDSGIYLRGCPQVQIWDTAQWPQGSGGLYNNEKGPKDPLTVADKPVGEWNRFRIRMIGDKVTVWLNDQLVVDNVVLENYWDRSKPVYPSGQIELQTHGTPVWFRNIFIREIPQGEGWQDLFNGKDLNGWEQVGGATPCWHVENGMLVTGGEKDGGWLSTTQEYDDFDLQLEFRLPPGGNSGVFIRAPREGNPAFEGSEIQILDDAAPEYADLKPYQYCGSVYATISPSRRVSLPAGTWQKLRILAQGSKIKVWLNGVLVVDGDLKDHLDKKKDHPGLTRSKGYIGLQNHGTRLEFRNIWIRPLTAEVKK